MLKKLFISLIFFLFSLLLIAEFKTNVHFISRREGLSNGAVNAIVKDAEGYIWFGTWNSLTRYEGNMEHWFQYTGAAFLSLIVQPNNFKELFVTKHLL